MSKVEESTPAPVVQEAAATTAEVAAVAPAEEPAAAASVEAVAEAKPFVVVDPTPAQTDYTLWGTHNGITCDGCGVKPLQGYRYKCRNCKNHDICETCFGSFKNGNLTQDPSTVRINNIGKRLEDHAFDVIADKDGSFSSMVSSEAQKPKVSKKVKPNEPCPCGSSKKYKKCCRV